MKLLDLILKAFASAGLRADELIALLQHIVATSPDLAPQAQKWIDGLSVAASPAAQAELALAIVKELGDVAQGHLDGRTHPGDGF